MTEGSHNWLRTIALGALTAGAIGSLSFLLSATEHPPAFLMILFVGWVLSPFAALFLAARVFWFRWVVIRSTVYRVMLVITLYSFLGYSGALTPSGVRPGFIFLVVPLISWLLMVVFIAIAFSRKGPSQNR